MNLATTTYFGIEERNLDVLFETIKNIGFDFVILSADKRYEEQNGSVLNQVKTALKHGLKIAQLHSAYRGFDTRYFWQKSSKGKFYLNNLRKEIDLASSIGAPVLVIHVSIDNTSITTLGIRRFQELAEYAKRKNVKLAIENLVDNGEQETFRLDDVLTLVSKVKSTHLGICFDCGHAHLVENGIEFDLLENYKDKIFAFHIHDNSGESDEHLPLGYGTVDKERLKNFVSQINIPITSEALRTKKTTLKEACEDVYNGLKMIV